MISTNPLRYPGGKTFLVNYIYKVLDTNSITDCTFYEPYAGSAAVSIEFLLKGIVKKIVIVEKDPLIYSFWKAVVEHTDELCEKIQEINICLETWYQLLPLRSAETPLANSTIDLGLAGLFFNRTNYSGILLANPIGGKGQKSEYKIDCRFNKQIIINRIKKIAEHRDFITVKWNDAINFLRGNSKLLHESNCFVYIDPPYYEQGKNLYRFYYKDNDHIKLANFIKKRHFPWLISYDDHPFINNLYFGQKENLKRQKLYCDYSAQKHKCGNELLISNLEIPPIKQYNSSTKYCRRKS